jgi:hypothetical protein
MEIEEIKTWQWVLAGLVVGLAFSCIVAWSGPTFDTQARDTIEQGEFENPTFALTKFGQIPRGLRPDLVHLYHVDQNKKLLPFLKDVMVHPPSPSDATHRYWVTGRAYFIGEKRVDPTKPNSPLKAFEEWRPFKYPAKAPYIPGYTLVGIKKLPKGSNQLQELADLKTALGGKSEFTNISEYLQAVSKLPDSNFKFQPLTQFAWWELPKAMWTLPPLAGVLMIGVAWPLALGILQRIGVAKPAPVKAKPAPVPEPKPIRAPSTAGVVLTPVGPKAPPPPVEAKKYGGEFYPVVKTTHKD